MPPRRRKKQEEPTAAPGSSSSAIGENAQGGAAGGGRMLSWHRSALHAIWDARPCVPSVTSRRDWASARHIVPIHVHNFFSLRKSRAKKRGERVDLENEGYELDVAEGEFKVVIIKKEVQDEEDTDVSSHQVADDDRIGSVHMPGNNSSEPLLVDVAQTPPPRIARSSTPIGTPVLDLPKDMHVFPLTPRQISSPIFGNSFYSPPALVIAPSTSFTSPTPLFRYIASPKTAKRKVSDAYNEPAWIRRKKRRLLDKLSSPPSPMQSSTNIAHVITTDESRVFDISVTDAHTLAETKRTKQGLVQNDNVIVVTANHHNANLPVVAAAKRTKQQEIINNKLGSVSSSSAFALSSPSVFALPSWSDRTPSSPSVFASTSVPGSSPLPSSSPITPAYTAHTQTSVYNSTATVRPPGQDVHRGHHYSKDRRNNNNNEVFLPPSREGILVNQEFQPLSRQEGTRRIPYPQPVYPIVITHNIASRRESCESVGWTEGGFDQFAVPRMAAVGRTVW